MAKEWECLSREEQEELIKALQHIGNIIGIDDSVNKIIIYAEDPQGDPYKVLIRWNKKLLSWQVRTID